MNGVTKKQAELLNVIRDFNENNGYTPSLRELAELTGRTLTPTHAMVDRLVSRGKLRRIAGSARSLEII